MNKQQIEEIVKRIVNSIGEVDKYGNSLGACDAISQAVVRELSQHYSFPKEIDFISPMVIKDGGYSYSGHIAVYLSKEDIVIDTQTWQYGRYEDLNRRKVLFSKKEYSDRGFVF